MGADLEACLSGGRDGSAGQMYIRILLNGVFEDQHFSYSLIPVYENGRIGGVHDAFRNMTETVVGAQRLRESEARLKLAKETAQLGVFVWDGVGDEASWENQRVYEIFGRTGEDGPVNGTEFLRDFIHPNFRELFVEAIERTLQQGVPHHFEGLMYRADRTLCRIELSGNLHPGIDGAKRKLLGTIRDVTECSKSGAKTPQQRQTPG